MKKSIEYVVVFLITIFILNLAIPNFLPELSQIEHTMASPGDGSFYLAENSCDTSFIYRINQKGEIQSVYSQKSVSRKIYSAITKLAADKVNIYYICETREVNSGVFTNWKIEKIENGSGSPKVIYQAKRGDQVPESITVENGVVFLIFNAKKNSSANVYSLSQSKKDNQLMLVSSVDAPEGSSIANSTYFGNTLYSLADDGSLMFSQDNSKKLLPMSEGVSKFSAYNGKIYAISAINGEVLTNERDSLKKIATIPPKYTALYGMGLKDDAIAVIAVNSRSEYCLLIKNQKSFVEYTTLKTSLLVRFLCKKNLFLLVMPICLAAGLLFLAASFMYHRSKKSSVRIAIVGAGFAMILMILIAAVVLESGWFTTNDMDTEVALAGENYISKIKASDVQTLYQEDSYGSENQKRIESLLEPQNISLKKTNLQVQGMILTKNEKGRMVMAINNDCVLNGLTPSGFDGEIASAVNTAWKSGKSSVVHFTEQGHRVSAEVRLISIAQKPTAVLISKITVGKGIVPKQVIMVMLLIDGIACIMFLILILLSASKTANPLQKLAVQMDAIAKGDLTMDKIWSRQDEIGTISNSMQGMCAALSIKDYEINNIVQSFYRFVPRGIEKVFDKTSVTDVHLGDMCTVKGSIGIACVNNRQAIRGILDDNQFMQFVNNCYEMIERQINVNRGYDISNSFNLGRMESVFIESPEDAISFSTGLLEESMKFDRNLKAAEIFLLLHTTSFIYGVAGTKERAFPFNSSSELDFLATVSKKFSGIDVSTVATEEYINSLKKHPPLRYIGFVASKDERYKYKLYELINCSSNVKREARISCKEKFEEGINLFYKNEFNLARSAFSSVLKVDNKDSIALWYLYACEHYCDSEKIQNIAYDLFGIE